MSFSSGTIFLNVWKRKTALLAYKWAVDGFEVTETNRPEFYGTKRKEVRDICFTLFT